MLHLHFVDAPILSLSPLAVYPLCKKVTLTNTLYPIDISSNNS
jgi:hypothetical protein